MWSKGLKPVRVFKQPFESQASLFQETYIRFAIGDQFFAESQTRRSWHAVLDARFPRLVLSSGDLVSGM